MTSEPPSTRSGGIARALGWSALASLAILLINATTGILLARELGPQLRGSLAAAMLWPALLASLGVLGLLESVSYFTARGGIRRGELVGSSLAVAASLGIGVTALTAALLPFVLSRQSDATLSNAALFLGSIPASILTLTLGGFINGCRRFRWFQVLRVVVVAGAATGLVLVAIAGRLDVRAAIWIYLGANIVTLLLAAGMARRLLDEPLSCSRQTARTLVVFGLKSFASTAAWRSNERIDQPIIAATLSATKLGLYVVAVTLSSLAGLVGASVVYVGVPAMAALTDADDRRRLARALIGGTLAASAVLTLPLLVATRPLLELLFGAEFGPVAAVARILLVASIVLSTNRAIESVLTGIGRPADAARAEILALPVTAVGLAILLPTVGLVGAAWSSIAAYCFAFALMSRRAAAALGSSRRRLLVPDRRDLRLLVALARRRSRTD